MDVGTQAQGIESLGLPLFSTDLYMPRYRIGQAGAWRLAKVDLCLERGYFSGLWAVRDTPVLMRESRHAPLGWETWMSLFPHEIESQELACRNARGYTVVMGLGMGWVAINAALNSAVRKVTVVECDADVIALFDLSEALEGLPEAIRTKIRVEQADALCWRPDEPVDFLYADIWRDIQDPAALADVRHMQANVHAASVYFWGQELLIRALAACRVDASASAGEWTQAIRQAMQTLGLPLLDAPDYPALVARAAARRLERGVPLRTPPVSARVALRPFTEADMPFLLAAYAASREAEKILLDWPQDQWDEFVRMQFGMQHTQYMRNYRNPTFDIIICDGQPAGRLYVDHAKAGIRIIDIIVMPEFRRQGIATHLLAALIDEAEAVGVPLSLHVEHNNPILSYYERLGFRICADREVYQYMERQPNRFTSRQEDQ